MPQISYRRCGGGTHPGTVEDSTSDRCICDIGESHPSTWSFTTKFFKKPRVEQTENPLKTDPRDELIYHKNQPFMTNFEKKTPPIGIRVVFAIPSRNTSHDNPMTIPMEHLFFLVGIRFFFNVPMTLVGF